MQINGCQVLISGQYNAFNEGWNGAGVYMCSGDYVSETFKLPIYIGSSKNLQERLEPQHINELNRNKHKNLPFQIAWNNHSKADNFIWFLLEFCEPIKEILLATEQKYLDLYRPFIDEMGGFNICHFARSTEGIKKTPEQIKRMSEVVIGRKRTRNSVEKGAEKIAQEWEFINPFGETVRFKNLSKFCRDNNLDANCMRYVYNNKRHHHKGWRKSKPENENEFITSNYKGAKEWAFIDPEGAVVRFKNLSTFAEANSLNKYCMYNLAQGKFNNHKGWTRFISPD